MKLLTYLFVAVQYSVMKIINKHNDNDELRNVENVEKKFESNKICHIFFGSIEQLHRNFKNPSGSRRKFKE